MKSKFFPGFPKEGLQFLQSLRRNNNREWFQEHRSIYEQHVKQPMAELVEALAADFRTFAPEMIASPKVSTFRIHRDTRFSKDKSPYKTHVAAVFPRSGVGKHEGAGFYVHIDPAEVFVGGGLYKPLPEDLNVVRSHIAGDPDSFHRILRNREFKKLFGTVTGEKLIRVPRGFPSNHPAAEYLKHKSFLAGRDIPLDSVATPRFYKAIVESFRAMLPFVRFLNEPVVRARRTRERQGALLG